MRYTVSLAGMSDPALILRRSRWTRRPYHRYRYSSGDRNLHRHTSGRGTSGRARGSGRGKRVALGSSCGWALYLGAMLQPATVGQSDTDERAAMQQAHHEREQENGGVNPQVSTSGAGASKGGGGLRYDNPGPHDRTTSNFAPGKTPLPSDAQAVFGTAIEVPGRACGTGQVAYGINEKGQFYRYMGQNGVLHYSGTIASNKVPKDIRKQLQDAFKQRQSQ